MAVTSVSCNQRPRPAAALHPFEGYGAQFNANIFRPTSIFLNPQDAAKPHPQDPDQEGQPHKLTDVQHAALRETIMNLKPGH